MSISSAGIVGGLFDELTFLAGLEFVGLDRDVLLAERLGRVPRSVRAEEVEPEHERLGPGPSALEPFDGRLAPCASSRCSLRPSAGAPPGCAGTAPSAPSSDRDRDRPPGEAKARLLLQPHVLGPWVARHDERVISLAAHPDHLVEPAPVAQPRLAQQGNVGDQGGMNALVPEKVGQDPLLGPKRRPALLGVGEPVPAGPPASAGRQRRQVFREMMVEDDSLGGQPVEVRRLDPGVAVCPEKPRCRLLQTTTTTFMN